MFDLISEGHERSPHSDAGPMVISWGLHLLAATALIVPLLLATGELPAVPDMRAFVAAAPPPPPPPPPPPAPAVAKGAAPQPVPTTGSPDAAPLEAPAEIVPERGVDTSFDGVPGGVEGGVPGGVIGGVLGGMLDAPPPPPQPPPAPLAPPAPIRVGGEIQAPSFVRRVDPVYPAIAVSAQMEGIVILEATVGRDGRVEEARVLRSIPLLDKAAQQAVLQWQYSPLLLNGKPERFIVTVTVSFHLKRES